MGWCCAGTLTLSAIVEERLRLLFGLNFVEDHCKLCEVFRLLTVYLMVRIDDSLKVAFSKFERSEACSR